MATPLMNAIYAQTILTLGSTTMTPPKLANEWVFHRMDPFFLFVTHKHLDNDFNEISIYSAVIGTAGTVELHSITTTLQ